MIVRSVALGLLATLALACSSNDEGSGSEGSGGAGGSGTGGAAGSGGDSVLSLAPPENGFQLSIRGRMIESGQDAEFCEVVQIPGTPDDVYYVNELEVEMAAFSHHLNVYSVVVGSPVDETAEVGDQHECLQPSLGYDNAGTFGDAFRYVIGSQTPTNWAKYPEGIGFRYVGGQKVIFNFHYLNTSKESVPARARVNFHTVDASLVSKPPQVFAMLNQTLNIPPRSKDSYTMQCTVRQDIDVFALLRHTHRWGTDFRAWYVGGERDGEELLFSSNWETETDFRFDPPMRVRAGEGFRFQCDFDNTEDHALRFGDKASDEMCILYGSWTAGGDGPVQAQSCAAGPGYGTTDADGVVHGIPIGWPAPDQG